MEVDRVMVESKLANVTWSNSIVVQTLTPDELGLSCVMLKVNTDGADITVIITLISVVVAMRKATAAKTVSSRTESTLFA